MIKEIQFQRRKRTIYAMNEEYKVVGQWECRDDFVPGYNASGDPRGSLPNGHTETFTSPAATPGGGISTVAGPIWLILMLITRAGFRLTAVSGCKTGTAWNWPR